MKQVYLTKISLSNFKGIKEFTCDFNTHKEIVIMGDNATGKTTIMDAYFWLFTDKTSNNTTENVKPYDKDGNIIHNLTTFVEAELLIVDFDKNDKKVIKLRKVLTEKWEKRRGLPNKQFTGNKYTYFINDVQTQESDYISFIKSEICEPELVFLLSHTSGFLKFLDWKKRREILMKLSGNTNNDVDENSEVGKILKRFDFDTKKAIAYLNNKKKELDNEIKEIEPRINEIKSWLRNYNNIKIDEHTDLIDIEAEIQNIQKREAEIKDKIDSINNKLKKDREEYNLNMSELDSLKIELSNHKVKFEYNLSSIKRLTKEVEQLREDYVKIKSLELKETDLVCPVCKRKFDEQDIKKKVDDFNKEKEEKLKKIEEEGKQVNNKIKTLELENKTISSQIEELSSKIKKIKVALEDNNKPNSQSKPSELETLENEYFKINRMLVDLDNIKNLIKRLKDLEEEGKMLSTAYASTERYIDEINKYVSDKIKNIETDINSNFKLVKFILFKPLVNGSIDEICEASTNGVLYDSINTASKINAGIDVINTLTKLYNISLPIWIDNRESVNQIIKTESQTINIKVNNDKTMQIAANNYQNL
jgi:chromosome segregation ATPase